MPAERERGDADRGREDGHLAGERLDAGQPEALVVGGDEDGVGGVDPERHPVGIDRAAGQQLGAAGSGELGGAVGALLGSRRVGGEEQVAAARVEAELRAGPPGAGSGGSGSRSGPQGRTAEPGDRGQARPPVLGREERARDGGDEIDAPCEPARERPDDRWRTSVPWKVTTSGRAPASRAHQPGRP